MFTSLSFVCEPFFRIARATALRTMLLIAACSITGFAQMGGLESDSADRGTGGVNMIQGNIFLPGGRRLNQRAKIKLRSATGGAELFQMSDDSGSFSFRRLAGGSYTLTIDAGNEYEVAVETVDIIAPARRQGEPGMSMPVSVILKVREHTSPGKVGTVDASSGGAPQAALELYKQAVASAQSGDRKKAIEQLKQALDIYPSFMTALNELGVQYMNLKEWRKAAESLRAAIKLGPEAFHPHFNYGIVLLQMKDYKEAAAELQLAAQKDSTSAAAYFQLGRALVNLNNYDPAEKCLKLCINIGGDDATEAHRYLAAVYIEKQSSLAAADELEVYLKLAPNIKDAERVRAVIKDLRSRATNKSR